MISKLLFTQSNNRNKTWPLKTIDNQTLFEESCWSEQRKMFEIRKKRLHPVGSSVKKIMEESP